MSRQWLTATYPASRFAIGSGLGVCCASLVINRRLYHIANVSAVSISRADKRRNILTDLAIGLGIPVIGIGLCTSTLSLMHHILLTSTPAQTGSTRATASTSSRALDASRRTRTPGSPTSSTSLGHFQSGSCPQRTASSPFARSSSAGDSSTSSWRRTTTSHSTATSA